MQLYWAHPEKTTLQEDQAVLNLEPTREKKARKTQEQLEKVCVGRPQEKHHNPEMKQRRLPNTEPAGESS